MRDLVDYHFVFGGSECWEAKGWIDEMLLDVGGDNFFRFDSSDPDLLGLHNSFWDEMGVNEDLWDDEEQLAKTIIHEGVHHGGEDESWAWHIETLCFGGEN